ncbi:MAG: molybdopterin-dependent oxidoreductase [Acidimicrobiia bacterium]|nr:molybdopterin-dependent oxidoreductase [Acidimicrobiia bacterium]
MGSNTLSPVTISDRPVSTSAPNRSVPMLDAHARVVGRVGYTEEFSVPGMLHARILRSPYAHARINAIDASRAEALDGVSVVLTRDDLVDAGLGMRYGPYLRDRSVVATEKTRFVGDPVAAVAAINEEVAGEAIELIDVGYEELKPVFDPVVALDPDAPLVHEGPRDIVPDRHDLVARSKEGTNIVNLFTQRRGDIEDGFAEADVIVEDVYTSPPVEHVPLESHNCIVDVRNDRITIWSSTQSPFLVQQQIAHIFGLPSSDVRVIVFTLGGGYGNKLNAQLEPIAALLSWKARQAVRLAVKREESFLVNVQHGITVRIRTGAKSDGRLTAHEATCYYNCGAYANESPNLITRGYAATGPYRVPNLKTDSYGVYTNLVPAGAFRGFGITQVAWPHERQMDLLADALDMDPLELRSKNVLGEGEPFTTGEPFPESHYPELLDEVARRVGWADGPLVVADGHRIRAKSVVSIVKGGSAMPSTAMVKLNGDGSGSLNLVVGSVEMGQGVQTALAQIAAEEAGLPIESVRVSEPDTMLTPYDHFTAASRTTFVMGNAVQRGVQEVKRQLIDFTSELLEVASEDLVVTNGQVEVVGDPGQSLSFGEVVRKARRGNIIGHGFFGPTTHLDLETGQGKGSTQWHPAAVSCEVEVDVETGKYEVIQLHAAVYVGRMINPRFCELQVEGSILFGLGQALFEELDFDGDGRPTNLNLSDYMIPSFLDMPRQMSVFVLETPDAKEVHGIGETAVPPIRPAIGNAVSRAIGIPIRDLPITPERVLLALEERRQRERSPVIAGEGRSSR